MIKVILVEDHKIVRSGLKLILDSIPTLSVLAALDNGEAALDFLQENSQPDVLITDLNMPQMDGFSLCEELKTTYPDIKVIVLSMWQNEAHISKAFEKGAKAYLLKNIEDSELNCAIQMVFHGGKFLCTEILESLLGRLDIAEVISNRNSQDLNLSDRELEVLDLIGEGYTNLEMADKLFLSKRTVEGHRQSLLEKTGSKNTATLIKYAVKQNLL